MKIFLKHLHATPLLMATLCLFWSCDDKDDAKLSEAVLASASALNFEGNNAVGQMITVYADAGWVTEAPEWITVSPASGNGVTDVTISVSENMRDGKLDNPRRAAMVFKGRTLASRCEVLVIQAGDKYRDVEEYTVGELAALDNETNVYVADLIVTAITTVGFVASDEQNTGNIYVMNNSAVDVNIGDKVTIKGTKFTNMQSLAYIDSDNLEIVSTGGTVTYPEPTDITDQVDTYNPRSIEFIVVSGILTGSDISVEGASYKVNITDAPASFGLADLNGHAVTVKGYFAGIAAPVIKILAAEVQDDGLFKVIYLSEDFNFLPAAYGNKILYATSPSEVRFSSWKWEDPDGREKWGWTSTPAPDAAAKPATAAWLYAREGYVKLGKTAVAGDLISPKLSALEDETVDVVVTFKACGYQTADGVQDIGHHLNISVIGPGTVSTPQFALEYYKTKEDGGDTYIWQDDSSNAYSFEITGATAETQIRFLAGPNIGVITTLGPNNSNRVAIDDIEVIKAN